MRRREGKFFHISYVIVFSPITDSFCRSVVLPFTPATCENERREKWAGVRKTRRQICPYIVRNCHLSSHKCLFQVCRVLFHTCYWEERRRTRTGAGVRTGVMMQLFSLGLSIFSIYRSQILYSSLSLVSEVSLVPETRKDGAKSGS